MSDPLLNAIQYIVEVSFLATNGQSGSYSGRFLARNPVRAEENARAFVLRFLRPSEILDVRVTKLST